MKDSQSSGQHLREEDIIVHQACIDYSQRDRNPMDSVTFLDSKTGQRVHHKQDDYTLLLTKQYQVSDCPSIPFPTSLYMSVDCFEGSFEQVKLCIDPAVHLS